MNKYHLNFSTALLLIALTSPHAFAVSSKREPGEQAPNVTAKRQRTEEATNPALNEEQQLLQEDEDATLLLPPGPSQAPALSTSEEESYIPAHALQSRENFATWVSEEGAGLDPDEEEKIFTALTSFQFPEDQINTWLQNENLSLWFRTELAEQFIQNAEEKNAFLLQRMKEDIENDLEVDDLYSEALRAAKYLPKDYPERNELLQQILGSTPLSGSNFEQRVYTAMAMGNAYAPKWDLLRKLYTSPLSGSGYKKEIEQAFSRAPMDPLVKQILALPPSSIQRNRLLLGYAQNETNSLFSRYKALLGIPWHIEDRTKLLAFLVINNPVPENLKKDLRAELAATRGVKGNVKTINMINLALQKLNE